VDARLWARVLTGHWPLATNHWQLFICEPTMNSPCGKHSATPAPSPSLLEIQPMVFPS
jgi:hypothetical protein